MTVLWNLAKRSFFLWFGTIWMVSGIGVFFGGITDSRGDVLPLIPGGLAGGIGTTLVIVNLRRIIRQYDLSRNGTPVEAQITQIRPSHYTSGRTHLNYIHYQYTTVEGGTYEGKSPPMHPRDTNRWAKGAKAMIRYDAAKPRESVWLDL
jgi:hypothetical protein